jgi:hypothetical protein
MPYYTDHLWAGNLNVDKGDTNKQTPWFQSAKRTIPTERPPLVG